MGQAKLKRALGAERGKPRITAGAVKTLAMNGATENGAPIVMLDFEDPAFQPIDFGMSPLADSD
jgi:hypothetical protein